MIIIDTETKKITPQDIMDKISSLAETMANLQSQIDNLSTQPVKEEQVESALEKKQEVSSEEAWESLFK